MGYLDYNGLAYFWSKVKSYVDTAASQAGGPATVTVNLTAAGWAAGDDGYYYQTGTAAGVTANNAVIIDTDNPEVKCTAQAANELTFRAIQAVDAVAKVMIFG